MSPRVALLAFSLLLMCGHARAEDPGCKDFRTFMNAGVEFGVNGTDWELALRQFDRAQEFTCSAADDARLALYRGVVLFNLRRQGPAMAAFKQALLLDPEANLPGKFGKKITALFEQVRRETAVVAARTETKPETRPETKPEPEKPTPDAPPSDTPIKTTFTPAPPTPPSVVATGPVTPQKSYVLPAVLGGTGAVVGGVGAFFGLQSSQAAQRAAQAQYQDDTRRELATASTNATVANVLFAVAGAAAVAGVVALLWPAPARAAKAAQ